MSHHATLDILLFSRASRGSGMGGQDVRESRQSAGQMTLLDSFFIISLLNVSSNEYHEGCTLLLTLTAKRGLRPEIMNRMGSCTDNFLFGFIRSIDLMFN